MSTSVLPSEHSWGAGRLAPENEARFEQGVTYCERFFMGTADAQSALYQANVADDLDPWVREKFLELWRLAQVVDPF